MWDGLETKKVKGYVYANFVLSWFLKSEILVSWSVSI